LRQQLNTIPECLREYWDFTVEGLAENMRTIDEFDLVEVTKFLKEKGIEFHKEQIIEDVAIWWLSSVI
jgi:hypothetical protein